jgi:hypothetical protein
MRRHRSIGLLAGTLLAMALATSVAAKGPGDEVVVTLDKTNDPHAGAPITIGVLLTRGGSGSAIRGETVTFQLARNGGIGLVTVPATEVTMGHYTATVTIPDQGGWTLIVNATGEGITQTFHAGDLQIGTPLPTATPASPAAPVMPAWLLIAGLVLLAAAAGIGGRIVATRRRSTVAPDRA